MAMGGVYLGGGIAPEDPSETRWPSFHAGLPAKGRMQPLMETIPVRVITNDKTALLGAGRYAALKSGQIKPSHP